MCGAMRGAVIIVIVIGCGSVLHHACDVRILLVEMNYYRHRHRYGRPATVVVVCNGIRVTRGWFGRACNDASRACVESRMCSTKLGLGSCEAYASGKRLVASQ